MSARVANAPDCQADRDYAVQRRAAEHDISVCSISRATTRDVEEHAASLREWSQVYEQLSPGPFVGVLHEARFAGVQVFRETTSQAVHEAGAARPGARAVGVPVRVDGAARFAGEALCTDDVVTIGSFEELDFYAPRGFEILGLVVDERSLDAYANQVEHRNVAQTLAGRRVLKPGARRAGELRRLLGSVLQSLDVNPIALEHAQTQRVLAQSLCNAFLDVAADDDAALRCPCAPATREQVVDAAKAFMRSRIAEAITVADLCRELGVSRRTLQYSFQQVLGTNPVAFLRAMRLNGVRRDLRSGERNSSGVADAAARWGFWHLGHFVTDYKRMFGELPSQTLRRS